MKLRSIFVVFTLLVVVKGAWMAAIVSPVMVGLGAVFSAIDQEVLNVQSFEWKSWLPFINKQAAAEPDPKGEKYVKKETEGEGKGIEMTPE